MSRVIRGGFVAEIVGSRCRALKNGRFVKCSLCGSCPRKRKKG